MHQGQGISHGFHGQHRVSGQWVDAAVGQGRRHDRSCLRRDLQRTQLKEGGGRSVPWLVERPEFLLIVIVSYYYYYHGCLTTGIIYLFNSSSSLLLLSLFSFIIIILLSSETLHKRIMNPLYTHQKRKRKEGHRTNQNKVSKYHNPKIKKSNCYFHHYPQASGPEQNDTPHERTRTWK